MKQGKRLITTLCVGLFLIASLSIGAVGIKAQESDNVASKLAEALDLYSVGKISDGLKIAQDLIGRNDLTSTDSIAIYEIMSLLTYSKGVDYINTAVDYLKKISNIGPCLIRLPRELWPAELSDQWYKLQQISGQLVCDKDKAGDFKTIAIMEFDNFSIGKYQEELGPIGKALADFFEHDFGKISDFKVVERNKINFVMKELELQKSGSVDQATAVKVGKLLGAHYMVFGSVTQLDGKSCRMVVRVVDVETSEIIESVDKEGKPEFTKMEKELVEELSGKLNVVLGDDVKKLIDEGGTESGNAMSLYAKGLEYMDRYDYKKAYDFFKQAYELDNTFVEAKRKMDIYRPLAT
ncbi:MAG: CsgG/HfaB family protein [bacterium]